MARSAFGFEARRQWPLWLLFVTAFVWLAATAASLLPEAAGLPAPALAMATQGARLLPPFVVLLLLAAIMPFQTSDPDMRELEGRIDVARRLAGDLETQLARVDALLGASAEKVASLKDSASGSLDSLVRSAEGLEVSAGTMALAATDMGRAAEELAQTIPAMHAEADAARAAIVAAGEAWRADVGAVEGMLARLAAGTRDAGRAAREDIEAMEKLLAGIEGASQETTRTIANRAYTLDAAVTGVLDRSTEALAAIGARVEEHGRQLEALVSRARTDIDGFGAEGTRAVSQRLDVLLAAADRLSGRFAEHRQLAATLGAETGEGIDRIEARIDALGGRQRAATDALVEGLSGGVARVAELMEGLNARQAAAVEALGSQVEASVAAFRARLADLEAGQADAEASMRARMAEAVAALEGELRQLADRQAEAASAMREAADAALAEADGRLAELGRLIDRMLADARGRVSEALDDLDRLGEAVGQRSVSVAGLRAAVDELQPALGSFGAEADARLPRLSSGVAALVEQGRALTAELDALGSRLASETVRMGERLSDVARGREEVAALGAGLADHFTNARAAVDDIHRVTEQTAIAAAARMVENVMQVRQSVNATSAEIQALLDAVVTEAEERLDHLASTKAEGAFGAPIRLQIVALQEAAQQATDVAARASEGLAGQLVQLMRTIAETEARIDEVDTRLDVRSRETLAARSVRLVEQLGAISVDMARLLSAEVEADAWDRWMKGDRGVFARATLKLADRETERKIARHYQHDDAFREEAARYVEQFELLMRRVLGDPDGDGFASVLLSSDLGKLYVTIAQAINRPALREAA